MKRNVLASDKATASELLAETELVVAAQTAAAERAAAAEAVTAEAPPVRHSPEAHAPERGGRSRAERQDLGERSPLPHRRDARVGVEHLQADVIGAGVVVRLHARATASIPPCDDRVDQPVAAAVRDVVVASSRARFRLRT